MKKFPETKDFAYWAIGLISLLIYFMTLKLTKNNDVVDYISFAGTLIGILLAVIAIIYAYQQGNQSSQSYSEIRALLSVISHNVKDIDQVKTNVALSNESIKELTGKVLGQNIYTGNGKEDIDNFSIETKNESKRFLDFQVVTTMVNYDFENPKKINNEEFIEMYVKQYRKVSGGDFAMAFNALTSDDYYSISFNLSVSDKNMTPNRVKAILETAPNDQIEIFSVARLIFAR